MEGFCCEREYKCRVLLGTCVAFLGPIFLKLRAREIGTAIGNKILTMLDFSIVVSDELKILLLFLAVLSPYSPNDMNRRKANQL